MDVSLYNRTLRDRFLEDEALDLDEDDALDLEDDEAPASLTFWGVCWSVALAVGWGAAQWWMVNAVVRTVGWEQLPYNTVEEVAVWLFLAVNASAWGILSYAIWRFHRPGLWLWWGACATWWAVLFVPFHGARAAFDAKVRASEVAGTQLVRRIEAFRKERGRLPGQLREIHLRDRKPIPSTAFASPFEYRPASVKTYLLVITAGDKTFCYDSAHPREGFRQRYAAP